MIRRTLLILTLATLVAGPSFAHTFELYGSVVGGDASGSHLVLETGSGPGYSRYTVVCAANHAATCAEMWSRVQQDSPVSASVEGQIIKQVANDALTQPVRFRATYWLFTISPLPLTGGGVTGTYLTVGVEPRTEAPELPGEN